MPNEIIQMPNGNFKVTIISKENYQDFKKYKKVYLVQKGESGKKGKTPLVCLTNKSDKTILVIAFTNPKKVLKCFDWFKNNISKTRFSLHAIPITEMTLEEFFKTASANHKILLNPPKEMQIPYY